MQVLKLSDSDISTLWDSLKKFIGTSLPPGTKTTDELMNNILSALLRGDMWCWAFEDKRAPKAIITGTVTQDICAKTRNLLIYSVWFAGRPNNVDIKRMVKALTRFAISQGCERLSGYTTSEQAATFLMKIKGIRPSIYLEADING